MYKLLIGTAAAALLVSPAVAGPMGMSLLVVIIILLFIAKMLMHPQSVIWASIMTLKSFSKARVKPKTV